MLVLRISHCESIKDVSVCLLRYTLARIKGGMSEVTKQDLQDAVVELKTYIEQRSEKVETDLLSAFHAWVRSMERDRVLTT
jgi:hypothetical protein